MTFTELDELEAEAIWAFREVAGAFSNPVMLYSAGKDSSVLLRLAQKAFSPGKIPFPLLHIDTRWKFREMVSFRDSEARKCDADLLVYSNPLGDDGTVTPFTHSIDEYTRMMKTEALRHALDHHGFDIAVGGARRDEERSRAKERMFSLREAGHVWNPRSQRPEFWTSVNPALTQGQTMRAFPLSNWTELDVWKYIKRERIDVVSLYFSQLRPTVNRQGKLIVVDDDRMPLLSNEKIEERLVRFRTLGCFPLSAAEVSSAVNVDEIIRELETSRRSERSGRLIDGAGASSMESKKLEGYF